VSAAQPRRDGKGGLWHGCERLPITPDPVLDLVQRQVGAEELLEVTGWEDGEELGIRAPDLKRDRIP
jgi:hypothetical protein